MQLKPDYNVVSQFFRRKLWIEVARRLAVGCAKSTSSAVPFASRMLLIAIVAAIVFGVDQFTLRGDGMIIPHRTYKGSLEEKSQEALIIFHASEEAGKATEDLILKIKVDGRAEQFAWIIPFPNPPEVSKEDQALFPELFRYVKARNEQIRRAAEIKAFTESGGGFGSGGGEAPVDILSRQIVGNFDVVIVRENEQGGLNPWLEKEGYQKLEDAEDVLGFYRQKKYVFACIKVSSEALAKDGAIESHPLRFTFQTGGRDGIYFPMKLTGLQKGSFDVNLYVLFRYWLNDNLSKYGYEHHDFKQHYRDWDSIVCVPSGGKQYSMPHRDSFLKQHKQLFPTVTKLLKKLHPGANYYLTNIKANNLKANDVRHWRDDLWLFPYYTDRTFVPFDARPGGVAAAGWVVD
ncbi:MAG: hypothetical protein JWM11_1922 [Planctomycetaceae bacterium]|nr:hypothetical protein [Planctomycetaceae bacterium]